MKLTNGLLSLEFDEKTGSLTQIEDQRHRTRHLKAPADGRLFRLVVPDEARWLDRHVESHTAGRPRFTLKSGTLTIRYPDARTADGAASGIEALATVSLPPGADEARFTLRLVNRGPHLIQEVWYPRIGGWRGYAGPGKDSMLTGGLI